MAAEELLNELLNTFNENKESNPIISDELDSLTSPPISRLVRRYSSELDPLSDDALSIDEDSALPLDIDNESDDELKVEMNFGAKIPELIRQKITEIAKTKTGFIKIDPSIITTTCKFLVTGYARENFDIEYILPDVIVNLFHDYYPKHMLLCSNKNVMAIKSGGENPCLFVVSKQDWTLSHFTQLVYASTEIVSLKQVPPETLEHVITYLNHHKGYVAYKHHSIVTLYYIPI